MDYNGVEYLPCNDFYFGEVFIKDITSYTIDELIEFAYCYSATYGFDCISIRSEYYAAPSFWTGKSRGFSLINFCVRMDIESQTENEIIYKKNILGAKYIKNGVYVDVPKTMYQAQYECL